MNYRQPEKISSKKQRQRYLLLLVLFVVSFVILIGCGAWLWVLGYRRGMMICVLPAILAMAGQMLCIVQLAQKT